MDTVLQAREARRHAFVYLQQHHDKEHQHGVQELLRRGQVRQVPPCRLHIRELQRAGPEESLRQDHHRKLPGKEPCC